MKITEAEILDALRTASAPTHDDDCGFTRAEIAENMGHSENWVSDNVLKPLSKQGKLVVGRRKSTRVDGIGCWLVVCRVAA
jgi:hypothetical protein